MILHTAETGNWVAVIIAVLIVGYIFYNFIRSKKQMNKPPSEKVKILSDANFNSTIKTGVSLVDFWAPWCGPCRAQGPIINDLGDEIGDKANICKLDIDKNQKTASQLGVQSIPTLILFKNGKIVKKFVGIKPKQLLVKAINAQL